LSVVAAIMQPYFFPYLGYFQLMRAVDVFVIYDDVQYMKGGWINRNRILSNGRPSWFTLPVQRDSLSLQINCRHYLPSLWTNKLKQQLHLSYARAPEYGQVYPLVCGLLDFADSNVAVFNTNLLTTLASKLCISCKFVVSSALAKAANLKGQDRVIDLCQRIGATQYVNPISGSSLYDSHAFARAGLDLVFLRPGLPEYLQFGAAHVPYLSIIDVLMFNSTRRTSEMLGGYQLAKPELPTTQ
jgi:hypothetical protein